MISPPKQNIRLWASGNNLTCFLNARRSLTSVAANVSAIATPQQPKTMRSYQYYHHNYAVYFIMRNFETILSLQCLLFSIAFKCCKIRYRQISEEFRNKTKLWRGMERFIRIIWLFRWQQSECYMQKTISEYSEV